MLAWTPARDVTRTCRAVSLGLLFARSLLELHLSHMQHGRSSLVQTELLLEREAELTEGFLRHNEDAAFHTCTCTAVD